jgi:hypothetical protein
MNYKQTSALGSGDLVWSPGKASELVRILAVSTGRVERAGETPYVVEAVHASTGEERAYWLPTGEAKWQIHS